MTVPYTHGFAVNRVGFASLCPSVRQLQPDHARHPPSPHWRHKARLHSRLGARIESPSCRLFVYNRQSFAEKMILTPHWWPSSKLTNVRRVWSAMKNCPAGSVLFPLPAGQNTVEEEVPPTEKPKNYGLSPVLLPIAGVTAMSVPGL